MADLQLQPILDALQRGDPTTAGRMARVHLADRPADGEAWFLLGIAQRAGGDPGTAAESYRRALVTHDRHADVWFNLGNALADVGDEGGAFDAYAHAAERDPGHVAALEQLARRGAAAGRADLGADAASRLAALAPYDLARQAAVLRALREAGRRDEAITLFHKVLPNALDHAGFLLEGGHLLEQQGDHRALAMLYQRLDGLMPDHAVVKFQLGLNRLRINQNSAALEALRGAEALGLTERALWVNLGTALARVDRVDEALTYLERAAPDYATDPSAFVFAFALKQKLCDWRGYEQLDATLLQPAVRGAGTGGYPALPFPFTAFPGPIDEADQLAIAKRFAEFVAKDVTPFASHPWKGSHQRVRVGYLSADFHDHATAHLMLGLFKRHDRARFEIFAYSHGPEDGSDYRARIRAEAEHFVDLSTLTDQGAAARIHADEIDVLVDLKGYTREARTAILAHRPAPVQVAWLGYPGSMGASFIDYALVDGIVAPPSQQPYYTERLLPMPHCYQPNDDEQTIAAEIPTRAEVGLPGKAVVFCSFCAHYKIDPAVFSAWMKILAAVPGSVLWLIDGYEAMRRNLRAQAQAHGIDLDRLVFAPRLRKPQHLARHALADVFLDTFAYNAHTTMSDALWAGLPAITVTGRTFATRVGASLLTAVGFEELIARDVESYVALAIELARNSTRRQRLRDRLVVQRGCSPLFDTAGFVRDWETRIAQIAPQSDAARATGATHETSLAAAIEALNREDNTRACELAEAAIEQGCERPDAWNVYAVALRRQRRFDLARFAYRRGIGWKPDFADMLGNYANLLREEDHVEASLPLYRQAVALAPQNRSALTNLAVALGANAQPDAQLEVLEAAERLEPQLADTHWDKALALLMLGRVREGLVEYEWRHARNQPPKRDYPKPEWRGEALKGRRIFLHWEQGYGDVLQFLRFVPLVVARGGKVVMEVQPGLRRLVQVLDGVVDVVETGEALPAFDCWASLLSVPRILDIDESNLPVARPYVHPPVDVLDHWKQRLGKRRKPRIGLVWAGNPNVKSDRLRSPRLGPLAPLFALTGVEWVLLQQGDGRKDLVAFELPKHVRDLGAEAEDFADTAAIMSTLDLVISSDTSTAHLAAALGCETWVLLHHASDWRWGLGDTSPWYPGVRLFRQTALGDWGGVVERVEAALRSDFRLPAAKRSARNPSPVPSAQPSQLLAEAFALYQRKRHQLARMVARAALMDDPLRPDAWCLLGVVGRALGDGAGAERAYRRAVELMPDYADAWLNLGNLLRNAKRLEQAREAYGKVVAIDPRQAQALSLLSDVQRELRDLAAAEQSARRALAYRPDFAEAWGHLGNVLNDLEQFDEAAECYERALRLPDCPPETHYNMGVALQRARKVEQAIACYREILSRKPNEVQAHYNLATSLLTLGRFDEGLREYEWRLAKPDLRPRVYPKPEWKGEPLNGRRVLLYWEQGCGDTLQFLRFVPLVAARGGRVILELQAGLKPLAAGLPGVEAVFEAGEALPDFDLHAPLLSAPARLGIGAANFPATIPYLGVPEDLAARWRARVGPRRDRALRVGLVWGGNPQVANDRVRSPRLGPLLPLFDVPGVEWHILQQGDGRKDLEKHPLPGRIVDNAAEVKDFGDTAAIMQTLDLVISSDTSTAHLAAALGIETWAILHFAADWRWMESNSTAWYPGLRIFRQIEPAAWPEAVARLRNALAERTAAPIPQRHSLEIA